MSAIELLVGTALVVAFAFIANYLWGQLKAGLSAFSFMEDNL